MCKIAMIDDGVNEGVFEKCKANYTYRVNRNGYIDKYYNYSRKISHGTICAAIIQQYANAENALYSIKIKPFNKNGSVENFIKAINFCVENDIKVINLSLGSTREEDKDSIYEAVINAFKKGIIVVAALSNNNVITYPASFPMVIAAKHSEKARLGLYYYKNYENFTLGVYSRLNLRMCNGTNYILDCANSFAAAYVTAKIVQQINNSNGKISWEKIKNQLLFQCINVNI